MYLEWSLSRMESRTEAMLSLLGVRFEPHPVRLVQAITPPLMTLLEQPAFRGKREMGVDTVSEHGIAVGFDLGLLLCRVILRVADPTFVVTVLRKPKSDLFYGPKWSRYEYSFRFSTDGRAWLREGVTRAVVRDASFCNPAWPSGC